jgi:hypothetical protein
VGKHSKNLIVYDRGEEEGGLAATSLRCRRYRMATHDINAASNTTATTIPPINPFVPKSFLLPVVDG